MVMPCLPGKHVWVERIAFKGSRYEICSICDKPRSPKDNKK